MLFLGKLNELLMEYCMVSVVLMSKLESEVVVTRKGQTTIPVQFREKFKIEEGTRLLVVETDEGILFKPKKSTWDLAGSGSRFATPEEMKKLLDKLREEDV
jgi:AbrB family looped-hinge helix DNA binding protein